MDTCFFCGSTEYMFKLEWMPYQDLLYRSPLIFIVCKSCSEETANSYCLTYNAVHRKCLREYTRKVQSEK